MKPLPTAPFTFEDIGIWVTVGNRFTPGCPPWLSSMAIAADRRDADLMLRAQANQSYAVLPDDEGWPTLDVRGRTWRRYLAENP